MWHLDGLGHDEIAERDLLQARDAAEDANQRMRMLFRCWDPGSFPSLHRVYAERGFDEVTSKDFEPSLERALQAVELLAAAGPDPVRQDGTVGSIADDSESRVACPRTRGALMVWARPRSAG